MSNRGKAVAAITSVILGLVFAVASKAYSKTLGKINIGQKVTQYKKLAANSVKNFFEIAQLDLRLEVFDGKIKPIYDGTKVIWNSDKSESYTLLISPNWISKIVSVNLNIISELEKSEVKNLKSRKDWVRKVSNITDLFYHVPFEKFQCRLISSNGKISKLLTHPFRRKQIRIKNEINAWVFKKGNDNYLTIKEPKKDSKSPESKIMEYKIILYMMDGKGIVRTIPPFKDYSVIKLGELEPCLCYIQGVRSIGVSVEQFVKWIGEEDALKISLDDY